MKLTSALIALAITPYTIAAGAVTIHFETLPDERASVEFSPIDSSFAAYGITFSDAYFFRCGATGGCPGPRPGMFAAGLYACNTFSITFNGTTDAVTFSNLSYSYPTAVAYDANGNMLSSLYGSDLPTTYTLAAIGIAKVAFTGTQFGIDDLSFQLNRWAPEPASWTMILGGFGLIGGALRSRKSLAPS